MKANSNSPLVIGVVAALSLLIVGSHNIAPRLVWNASASAPEGLYSIRTRPIGIGDYVLISPPDPVKSFIEERGYLPENTPLLKRVAAAPGAEICREGARILIDKTVVAYALLTDSQGRPMPQWEGCFTLQSDEIFVLNDHERSLDGRYFGAMSIENVVGVATPIWTFSSRN